MLGDFIEKRILTQHSELSEEEKAKIREDYMSQAWLEAGSFDLFEDYYEYMRVQDKKEIKDQEQLKNYIHYLSQGTAKNQMAFLLGQQLKSKVKNDLVAKFN